MGQALMPVESTHVARPLTGQLGSERALWQSIATSVQQLEQQAHERDLLAAEQQAQRDAQQAALAQQAQGPGPGGPGPGASGPPGPPSGPGS